MVYSQPRICPEEWDTQTPLSFWHTNGSPYLFQMTRSYNNQQKKKKKKEENLQSSGLCGPSWLPSKTERMWKEG